MLQDILEAIACREEELKFLGRDVIVREVDISTEMVIEDEVEKEILDAGAGRAELGYWKMFVRSVTLKETGAPLFDGADIAKLRKGARGRLAPLCAAVNRVNGLDADLNAKK
jgi:hypothetical protein